MEDPHTCDREYFKNILNTSSEWRYVKKIVSDCYWIFHQQKANIFKVFKEKSSTSSFFFFLIRVQIIPWVIKFFFENTKKLILYYAMWNLRNKCDQIFY